ncbi:MAG: hypothetical protein ABFD98_03595, partial [Syntrophobacteraceae bacterium]|nr:hypothetical protein [Desulfobacteraceae bacterium]
MPYRHDQTASTGAASSRLRRFGPCAVPSRKAENRTAYGNGSAVSDFPQEQQDSSKFHELQNEDVFS